MMMLYGRWKQLDVLAFFASSLYIGALLSSVAWGLFPNILIATKDPTLNLTIYNASTSPYSMQVGLVWFSLGITLVAIYTVYVYRSFWGKVDPASVEEGY